MRPDDNLIEAVAAHVGSDPTEVASLLERVVTAEANAWRLEWIDLLFPGLPADLRSKVRQCALSGPQPPERDSGRIGQLRALFAGLSIHTFLVPNADEHQGRDVPAHARRLRWLTGFSGSAGTAVVAEDKAWLFVDGRYTLQASQEVDGASIEVRHVARPPMWRYLAETLPAGSRLGYDARLHPSREIADGRAVLDMVGIVLVPLAANPIDAIWTDRPPKPFSAVVPHPDELSGSPSDVKRDEVADALRGSGVKAFVLHRPESIAWLFNIRAGDASHTPVAEAYAVVRDDGHADLFIETRKLTREAIQHLGNRTTVRPFEAFDSALAELGAAAETVAVDAAGAPQRLELALSAAGAKVSVLPDPTLSRRMHKNAVELEGLHEALARDGAALARFLRWLSELPLDALPDELEIAERVTAFRAQDPTFRGTSFPPIVGIGPNGAVIHYHPTPATNRRLEPGTLLLVDSGGQYLTGTTDITRTICVETAPAFEREVYTTVLKGHIALARARFPRGTTGAQLDGIARAPIWRLGIEYDHGTGHGIGSYLGVHEGPVRIAGAGDKPLEGGYVMSNEPGAYFAGRFGIRIENTMVVVKGEPGLTGEEFLEFDTVSVAPFDRNLIDATALSAEERDWVDRYHAKVWSTVGPRLSGGDLQWLEGATRPLSE